MLFQRLTHTLIHLWQYSTGKHTGDDWKWDAESSCHSGVQIIKKLIYCGGERWLLVTLIKWHAARTGDCGRSGVESVSAALVEACQPTERIRDANIHRKHSPRYTDVPVFVNRWNKAESTQRETDRRQREKEDRNQGDRGGVCDYRKLLGHLEAAHAIKRDVKEDRRDESVSREVGGVEYKERRENWVRPTQIFQSILSQSDINPSVTSNCVGLHKSVIKHFVFSMSLSLLASSESCLWKPTSVTP